MIISHKYRFLYFGPPKTGSTSLHRYLSQKPFCNELWTHELQDQHTARIPPGCEEYLKVASWREPLDREVSLYRHFQHPVTKKAEGNPDSTFEQFVKEHQPGAIDFYSKSQTWWLNGIEIDRWIHLDRIQWDLACLEFVQDASSRTMLEPIQKLNPSMRLPPAMNSYYTPETRRIVLDRFAEDVR